LGDKNSREDTYPITVSKFYIHSVYYVYLTILLQKEIYGIVANMMEANK